jgi:hypothetical protein
MVDEIKPQEDPSKMAAKDTQGQMPTQDEWKKITGDKYKTAEELAKSYKELEKKLGEQGEKIRTSEEFASLMTPLLEEIRNDPEVFDKLDKKLRKRNSPDSTSDKDDTKGDKKTTNVSDWAFDKTIAEFEDKHGFKQLSADEVKTLRSAIGDVILDLTGKKLNEIDLNRLEPVLENAYILANKDKLMKESALEALVSAKGTSEAAIGSISSSSGKTADTLSPEEATVAERLGISREQYLKGKKSPAK